MAHEEEESWLAVPPPPACVCALALPLLLLLLSPPLRFLLLLLLQFFSLLPLFFARPFVVADDVSTSLPRQLRRGPQSPASVLSSHRGEVSIESHLTSVRCENVEVGGIQRFD